MGDLSIVKGQMSGILAVSALYDPHFIPLSLQVYCGDWKEVGWVDEEVLLERVGVKGQ